MHKRNNIILRCFLKIVTVLITINIAAQDIFIKSSSQITLNQSVDSLRKDFYDHLVKKDYNLLKTLNTQVINFKNDTIKVFLPTERAIALFLGQYYQTILKDIINRFDYHYFIRSKDFKRNKCRFTRIIAFEEEPNPLLDLNHEKGNILLTINQSTLNDDEKDFLKLYLNSILSYIDLKSFDTEQMNKDSEDFLKKYPNSKYSEYVNKVLNIRLKTMNFGIGAGIFSGYNVINGNISKYFNNYIPIGFDLELGYKRIILISEISPSFSRHTKETFLYKNNTWATDSTPFIIDGNFNLGYAIINNSKFKITPYVGIGTHGINLTDGVENMVFKSNLNLGLDFDWKFGHTKTYGSYYEAFNATNDDTYWYLRLKFGYSQFNHEDTRFNGSMIYTKLEIGFYSNPARRLKIK